MAMEDAARTIAEFVRAHETWAMPIVFALAFAESIAFISLFIPAWGALIAIGALVSGSAINPWPIWFAAALGAVLGDWLSYWFGHRYQHSLAQMWPLSRYPALLPRGEDFVKRWGVAGIFVGRFWGPLRAVVPLAAGIFEMPRLPFQIANVTSAMVWAASLLLFGDVMAQGASRLWQATH